MSLCGFYTYIFIYMYIKNIYVSAYICIYIHLALKSDPLVESYLHFIFFVEDSAPFLWYGNDIIVIIITYFLAQLWKESWDLQKAGRNLSKVFLGIKSVLLL